MVEQPRHESLVVSSFSFHVPIVGARVVHMYCINSEAKVAMQSLVRRTSTRIVSADAVTLLDFGPFETTIHFNPEDPEAPNSDLQMPIEL